MPLSRTPLDAQWQRILRENLVHTATVEPLVGQDVHGQPTYGNKLYKVPCFATQGKRRVVTGNTVDYIPGYQVHFKRDVPVSLNMLITEMKDRDGTLIFQTAKATNVDDSDDSRTGRIQWLVFCEEQ